MGSTLLRPPQKLKFFWAGGKIEGGIVIHSPALSRTFAARYTLGCFLRYMKRLLYKTVGTCLNVLSLVAPKMAAYWASYLFSTPRKPNIRAKEASFLATARQVHRTIPQKLGPGATLPEGTPIQFVEYHWGYPNAPLVLLSYGWVYNAGRWRYFVQTFLEAGYRVIAYDPPGHGYAPKGQVTIPVNAAIVAAIIEANGPVEVLIGHSFGGASSVFALSQLPKKLHPKRMVVMASFSYGFNAFRTFGKALCLRPTLFWNLVRRFEARTGYPIEHFDCAVLSGQLEHVAALIVHSPDDEITPYYEATRYHAFWPGSRLLSPLEGGHHLGTASITRQILAFSTQGVWPAGAVLNERTLEASHELTWHFVGI